MSTICSTTRSTYTFHLGVFNLQWDAVNNFNDLLHRTILHPLLCYDPHNFHDFLHNSFRSPLLRNHLDPLAYRRFVPLCIVNVGLLDHFLRFFIRELLTYIFLHVALILCKVGHFPVNATVVQLCEEVHHGGQLGVHVRFFFLRHKVQGSRENTKVEKSDMCGERGQCQPSPTPSAFTRVEQLP